MAVRPGSRRRAAAMTEMQPDPRPESEVEGLPDTEGPIELSEELTEAVAEALDAG